MPPPWEPALCLQPVIRVVSGPHRCRRSLGGPNKGLSAVLQEGSGRARSKNGGEVRMRASQPSFGSKMDQIFLKRLDLQAQIICLLPAPGKDSRSVAARRTIAKTAFPGKRETRGSARSFRSGTHLCRRPHHRGTGFRPARPGSGKCLSFPVIQPPVFAVRSAPRGTRARTTHFQRDTPRARLV